ncbi:cupin domain-containing protein [Candidatus Bipolaricaulota bacterium]|nr:cupin domain-containing protein [Candidatus Bipolaricaulota bacterium]
MKIQHLVLDDDVHKALKARKKATGITVKEIGNSALRAALSLPTLEDLIVDKLVATGKVSRQDYAQAVAEANKEIKTAQKRAAAAVAQVAARTWTAGGWEIREVHLSADGELQVLDLRPRGGARTSTPNLVHEASHAWVTVLAGKVKLTIGSEERTPAKRETVHIPPGTPHTLTPLTQTARALLVLAPAAPPK